MEFRKICYMKTIRGIHLKILCKTFATIGSFHALDSRIICT